MPPSTIPSSDGTSCTGTAAVVGGGIAGLCAAVALRRAGWKVSIYERSKFKNEVGAGITVPPNAGLVLRHLGFDFEKARPVANETTRLSRCDAPSGEYYMREVYLRDGDQNEPASRNGEVESLGSWTFHRVDLHRGLRELAEDPDEKDGKGRKVEMNLGVAVEKADCEEGVLTLPGGRTVKVDLAVIADGAHVSIAIRLCSSCLEGSSENGDTDLMFRARSFSILLAQHPKPSGPDARSTGGWSPCPMSSLIR